MPTPELIIPKYCESIHQTRRRPTRTVTVRAPSCFASTRLLLPCQAYHSALLNMLLQLQVGPVKIGSEHPIALQTMTTTDTRNIQATVDQVGLNYVSRLLG